MERKGDRLCFARGTSVPATTDGVALLQDLGWIRAIEASQCGIRRIPPWMLTLPELLRLELGGNEITEVPAAIGNLKKLTHLYLSGNRLTSLPREIWDLTNLVELFIGAHEGKGKLTALPPGIGQLKSLTSLDVKNNSLTELPDHEGEFGNLENLMYLSLTGNPLTGLPASITGLKKLVSVDMNNCPFTRLPRELEGLYSLTDIEVMGCPLDEFPYELGVLPCLQKLEIDASVHREIKDREPGWGEGYGNWITPAAYLRRAYPLWVVKHRSLHTRALFLGAHYPGLPQGAHRLPDYQRAEMEAMQALVPKPDPRSRTSWAGWL